MRAYFFKGPLEFEPRDVPHPGAPAAGEMLLRVEYAGICGSDLKPYKHGVPSPLVSGHEVGAVVEALGEEVRLAVDKPDARAFIAGDDVQGLTAAVRAAVLFNHAPGIGEFRQAGQRCGGAGYDALQRHVSVMITPTADKLRRLAELRARSAELDREIQQKAHKADAAAKKTPESK